MKTKITLGIIMVWSSIMASAEIRPVRLNCENINNPMVVDIMNPRLSWINIADENERGQFQIAREIRVASSMNFLISGKADLWNSGKILSGESFNIPYEGKSLTSRQDCWWQVRVWDRKGKVSGWSEPAFWSMGLLLPSDWEAQWIGAPWQGEEPLVRPPRPKGKNDPDIRLTASVDQLPPPAPMLRKSFQVDKEVASARAYVTGLGFFEFYVNGEKVSNDVLTPNLTLYGKRDDLGPIGAMIRNNFREYRVMYLAYDIGKFLKKGENVAGTILGNGFYNVTGDEGHKIEIKYLCESPLGYNSYIMKGGSPESYSARFTWFVFREVELINWPGELKSEQIRAEAVYTKIETTGKFDCSNPLFNKINKIWWRSQTDNMHGGIASDCPHRERSPYTGDGQVSCVTVMHNLDARAFYTKWIQDILGAQNPETGYVPNGAPWQPGCGGGVGWGAAMNIMPWEYYIHYGDIDLLINNYEGMKGYIKYMLSWVNEDGIMFSQAPEKDKSNRWINVGDWVSPFKFSPYGRKICCDPNRIG